MTRKSKGRRKIEMTRMSKESNLLVTFSKRRSGLFKKASELCILCGAEVAIVVFSPGKKVFSFGHPCIESIIGRFLTRKNPPPSTNTSTTFQLIEAHRDASVREHNKQLIEVLNQLEAEKKRGEEISNVRKVAKRSNKSCWWEGPIEELGLLELEQLKVAMEELKKDVANQEEKIKKESLHPSPFLGGSSSIGGLLGGVCDTKVCGLGLTMTPHGYTLGYGHGFSDNFMNVFE